jgi:hypothetical protein
MSLHFDTLGPPQNQALEKLGPIATAAGFYLARGTALGLHLGHRHSRDLDWFTAGRMGPADGLVQLILNQHRTFRSTQVSPGMVFGKLGRVETSFIEYRYRLLAKPKVHPSCPCALASLRDLAAMKLLAVAQRGHKRDLVDIYALLRAGFSLEDMIDSYKAKYRMKDTLHLLNALVYFGDADPQQMPLLTWKMDWREVKATLRAKVQRFIAKHSSPSSTRRKT